MIKVAINGYGNLGRGVERAVAASPDMECVVVFTRRDPGTLKTLGTPVAHVDEMEKWVGKIDVCLNCGGSATDLGTQGPATAKLFNTVDSFDNHGKIPEYFAVMDEAAREGGHTAIISTGWDPGLFSMLRVLGDAVLPNGSTTTFWGPGVSQGHSDAIRRIAGVVDARQYTVPVEETVAAVQEGADVELTPRTMHRRVAYVVAQEGSDLAEIERQIVEMPNYFAPYDTEVHFISAEQMATEHAGLPHGGQVIHTGQTSEGITQKINFSLGLESNPEFTGAALTATARACAKMAERGYVGAATVFDVTLSDLSPRTPEQLRKSYL
ncbi:MAG: diaminopimelate dehydrogenase [Actinomycetaceae bacterium]|nr:diaminopimelate dehydrogenase [Actinomycetaceae bacterium]